VFKPLTTMISKFRTSALSTGKSDNSWQSSTIGGGHSRGGHSRGHQQQGGRRPQQQDPDKPWAIEMRESFEVTHSVNPTSTDKLHRKIDDDENRAQRNNSMRNNSMRRSDGLNQISDDEVSTTHETLTKYPY
jgi:hypothetical protein